MTGSHSRWALGALVALGALASGAARANGKEGARPEAQPRGEVLWKLHAIHLTEVGMARLGTELAQSSDVRAYALQALHDHRMLNKSVLTYAAEQDLRLDPGAGAAEHDEKAQRAMDALRAVHLGDFDREFLALMVRGHTQACDFARQARGGSNDREMQKLLDDLSPTLQRHRDRAVELQSRLKAGPPPRSGKR